ncbi:MAG: hypothetical protein ACREHV_17200 [Rhizomicrobium sp.]
MPKRYAPKDLRLIFDEMSGGSDRACILVGGSLLEHELEEALLSRFRSSKNAAERNALFTQGGILGSFEEKCWAAYFLRVIGPAAKRDIDLIRSIRNEAAHDMNAVSFEKTQEIANRCRELRFMSVYVKGYKPSESLRANFDTTVRVLTLLLAIRSREATSEMANAIASNHLDEKFLDL